MAKKPALERTSGSIFDASWNDVSTAQTVDEMESKRISVWAVAALVVAVLSLLSFVQVSFTIISLIAVLFAVFAFATIAKSGGEVVGKKIACVGLALALITAIGGPTRRAVYRIEFERQAAQFCEIWFDAAKRGDVCQIRQMLNPYWRRATIMSHKDEVDFFVRDKMGDEEPHYKTHAFLANPTLLTLAELGDRAKHSFYCTTTTWITNSTESTERIYAVTVEPDLEKDPNGKKQTFFFRLVCNRTYNRTEDGKKLFGWSTIDSDLNPVELDKNGRPIWEKQEM